MGVSSFDKTANEKKLDQKYTLTTTKGVKKILKNVHTIKEGAYERGDMAAIDLLIDLDTAIDKAKLTKQQRRTIELYYFEDMTQAATAKQMGIKDTTESVHRNEAVKRITTIYTEWNYN